ncbi:hypothetical protein GUJ93_ZPchr0006g42625 [Zizania palustris]|uniref:TmcB/TmcC TPR repeats domain-containing protein n=1 Tax=Zizania palustris TaxID=103762 RepID=A0A8J5VPM9_ZIZPA|nr:hypothetical protein GUJ93_ZPchr0006g42625 [Zizania palustris]
MRLLRSASSPLQLGYAPACAAARVPAAAEHGQCFGVAAALRQGPLCRASSEGDINIMMAALVPAGGKDGRKEDERGHGRRMVLEEEGEEEEDVLGAAVPLCRLLTSTGLDVAAGREGAAASLALLEGVVGGGGGSKKVCSGGEQGGDSDSHRAVDAHYRRMIQVDPDNPLLLGNYAKFLKEVEGDVARAQEYCERAIVANPGDGEALALYAGLVWETSRDADRADAYYTRAVQAAPDDCYVLGSYAGFLWDAEEDDEHDGQQHQPPPPPPPFPVTAQRPSITAAT